METKHRFYGWKVITLVAAIAFISKYASSNDDASLKVKLNGVCPVDASQEKVPSFTFEMAKHPRLTFELVDDSSPWEDAVYAGVAPIRQPKGMSPKAELLKSVDLEQENLFHSDFKKQISFPQPSALGSARLRIYVCDDANEDGRCSDEPESRQIGIKPLSYRPDRLPESLAVLVRAGCN